MTSIREVLDAYGEAWARRGVFVPVHLATRIAAYAVIAPLTALVINLVVSLSNQPALTDQDIALFLLGPVGFLTGSVAAAFLLLAEVLGFAVMAAALREDGGSVPRIILASALAVLGRLKALFLFALLFVLKVVLLVAPFAAAALAVALVVLGDYDINYYLAFRPPEFLLVVAIAAGLGLVMAWVLLMRLSGWAVALHLVLFADAAPARAFAESARRMQGRRFALQRRLLVWAGVTALLQAVLGAVTAAVVNLVPLSPDAGLSGALFIALSIAALWGLAGLILSSVSMGALAVMLDRLFDMPRRQAAATAPETASETAPAPAARPAASAGWLAAAGAGVAALGVAGFWAGSELIDAVSTHRPVEVIGHRGAAASRPENTMAAMLRAMDEGADWLEIDVQRSADDQVIVMHDSDFMKLAGVDLKVGDATQEDLARIDIGSWFDPAWADQRVPLLRDVLEAAKGRSRVLIELKYYGEDEELADRVVQEVESTGMQDRIAIMSLKYPAVLKMRAMRPDWRTGVLAATAVGNLAALEGDFVAINAGLASAALARTLHDAGKDLYVWTVNDPVAMSRMISLGVDGIITDDPALAREVLRARAEMSGVERLALWLSDLIGLDFDVKEPRDDSP